MYLGWFIADNIKYLEIDDFKDNQNEIFLFHIF